MRFPEREKNIIFQILKDTKRATKTPERSMIWSMISNLLTLKFCVIQALYCIHGLIRIGHVHKGKVLDNGALCDCAILFKQIAELLIKALFYIGYVELHWALIFPSAGLHIDGSTIQLIEMEFPDGFGGCLAIFHMDKSIVFVLCTFCYCAVLGKQSLNLLLLSVLRQVPNKNLHHGCSSALL